MAAKTKKIAALKKARALDAKIATGREKLTVAEKVGRDAQTKADAIDAVPPYRVLACACPSCPPNTLGETSVQASFRVLSCAGFIG